MRTHGVFALLLVFAACATFPALAEEPIPPDAPAAPEAPPEAGAEAAAAPPAEEPVRVAQAVPEGEAKPPIVERGIFPKALRIPGTDVYVAFGGYAKVDFIQDFDAIGNAFEFQTNSIPAEGTPDADHEGGTTLHARETRLSLEFRSGDAPARYRVYFEGDFFGDNGSFRMRHGYGEFGRILGGQTWSTFMDFSARPLTVDYEGPDSEVFVRQAMIRYTQPLSKHWTWAIAVENPSPQFVVPVTLTGEPRSKAPDVPTYFRWQSDRAHVQLAAIARQIRFDGEAGSPNLSEVGWGFNLTGRTRTWNRDEVMGQIMHGEGVGRYVESFSGQSSDAVVTAANELELLPVTAMVVGYIHHWSEELRSGISFSAAKVDTDPIQPGTAIEETRDARVNLIWTPYRLVDYAAEVLWGSRENIDGSEGDAFRLQFALVFRFN